MCSRPAPLLPSPLQVSGPEPSPPLRSWQDLQHCVASSRAAHDAAGGPHAGDGQHHAQNGAEGGSGSEAGISSSSSSRAVEWLLQNLRAKGYAQPTPIQRQAIPTLLAARELLAVAPTGVPTLKYADHRCAHT